MTQQFTYPSVLTIAGFDGSGGAGIQADIKTISALGCFATSVLTALPVQNTTGVKAIYPIPANAVKEQISCILDDIRTDAIKIGMVHTTELVEVISATLREYPGIPVVFDTVMVATSGHRLIEEKTIDSIVSQLFPITTLVTPNLDEASLLAGMSITTVDDMYIAGEKIKKLGCNALLLKGGHLASTQLTSLFFDTAGQVHAFEFTKQETRNTHGTGCTLSSACASYLAQGKSLPEAVTGAQEYVYQAILHGMNVVTGKGKGPLNHFFAPRPLIKLNY